jgi:hypothetical protein
MADVREMIREFKSDEYKAEKAKAKSEADMRESSRARVLALMATSPEWQILKNEIETETEFAKTKMLDPLLPARARMYLCGYVQGLQFLVSLKELEKTKQKEILNASRTNGNKD